MRKKIFTFLLALAASVGMSWAAPAVAVNGKLPGKFSVSATKKVYFSQGNLQYNSNNQRWQFAENQYSYIGNAAGNTSITESGIANNNGIVDLFCWVGASSSWTGLKQYGITSKNPWGTPAADGYGTTTSESLKSDWGKLAIYNGGNTANSDWFTLSKAEWVYLLGGRTNASNLRTHATVNGVKGLIIMPDGWTANGVSLIITQSFNPNQITSSQWTTLEGQGCVFLPAAGYRSSPNIFNAGEAGRYWHASSALNAATEATAIVISQQSLNDSYNANRYLGHSVRLVSATPPVIKVTNPTITLSQSSYTYNGTARKPSVTVKNGNTTIPSSEYTVSYSNNVNAGTATVTITDKAGGNYEVSGSKTFTINKANCTFTTTPSAKSGLTYNGSAQNLINAGAANVGTMQYKIGSGGSWSNSIPTATNAGSYTVYYKIIAPNNNYNGNSGSSFSVTIAKANPTVTAPTAKANLTYSGSAQALVNAGSTNGGTMKYSLDNSTWNTSVPTGTNAGSYTVYYKVEGNSNYNGNNGSNFQVTIAKSSTVTISTLPAAIENLEYTGSAQPLINAGATNDGTMQYSLDGTNWSTSIPTGTLVGEYTVYYKVVGDANHNDYTPSPNTIVVAIAASNRDINAYLDPKKEGVYYSTFFDSRVKYELPANVEAYTATVSGDKMLLKKVAVPGDILPAATAVVLRASQADFTLTPSAASPVSVENNALHGTDVNMGVPSDHCYVLSGADGFVGFYPLSAPYTLTAHKAYIDLDNLPGGANNAPRRLRFVFSEEKVATGVENTDASAKIGGSEKVIENGVLYIIKNGVRYNAQGQIVK